MAELHKTSLTEKTEATTVHLDNDGTLSVAAHTQEKKSGLYGFFASLMEAHRYVHNRRSASHHN